MEKGHTMRFRKEAHKPGALRYRKRFAFWPTFVDQQHLWLESYFEKLYWCEYFREWKRVKLMLPEDIELSPLNKALE